MLIICEADIILGMKIFDPEKSIGFLIYEVSRLMRRDFDERVQPLGLTQVQWRAIAHISCLEGCRQAVLAELLEIKPITLTRLLDRLEESDWVVRRPDQKDRRAIRLYLSEKARPLLETMAEKSQQTRARAVAGIDEDQFVALFEALKKMKENLT